MENYSLLIRNKEPLVVNAWGFVDGVFFEMDDPSTPSVQNAYYNGWKAYCSVYKRLNGKLKYNVVFNKMLLRIIIRLFNYRSRRVGLNQIRSVFAPQQ